MSRRRPTLGFVLLAMAVAAAFAAFDAARSDSDTDAVTKAAAGFRALADRLAYVELAHALYGGRSDGFHDAKRPAEVEVHESVLSELVARRDPREVLHALLKHEDANVRTLALYALFQREDPRDLDAIAAIADDTYQTLDGRPELREPGIRGVGPPQQKQTVGDIASAWLHFTGTPRSPQDGQTVQRWWLDHKQPEISARWLLLRMRRANWEKSPADGGIRRRVAAFRKDIDRIPMPHRAWVLLRLHQETSGNILVSRKELVALLQELGPDALLGLLQRKIPSTDPLLQPQRSGNYPYKAMCAFVLRHAQVLLRPDQAEAIRACAAHEHDYVRHNLLDPMHMGWWFTAAATLDPKHAREHLEAGLSSFRGDYDHQHRAQAEVMVGWQHALGEAGDKELLDWFFGSPKADAEPNSRHEHFLHLLAEERAGARIVHALSTDPRFAPLRQHDSVRWALQHWSDAMKAK